MPPRAGVKLDEASISAILSHITIRPTGFEKAAAEGGNASVSPAPEVPTVGKTIFVSEEVSKSERSDLASARVVISGGRGLKGGMKDSKTFVAIKSKTIVAINKDEEAPIFQVADYGLVDDLFTAVPKMTEKI
ncbi:hypothetical protein KXD40_006105 [Peronospora effusa]|nr:hypothetical protein KXD40_006105 [Peronospora effusa]